MIVIQIKHEDKLQVLELVRHSSTKLTQIYVKECEIGEECKPIREIPSNVTMIEIDFSDGSNRVVAEHCSTKNFGVVTHIKFDLFSGERSVVVWLVCEERKGSGGGDRKKQMGVSGERGVE
ncbi:hypothetical protein CsSME_00026572 [Camellia sinensis var. sinensis]